MGVKNDVPVSSSSLLLDASSSFCPDTACAIIRISASYGSDGIVDSIFYNKITTTITSRFLIIQLMFVLLKYYLDLFHDAVCRLARRGDEAGHRDGERQNDRLGNRNVVHGHGHGDEDGDGHGNECALRQVLLLYKSQKYPLFLWETKKRGIWDVEPVWVPSVTACGRHIVALVCVTGLHSSILLRIAFGSGGWTMTCVLAFTFVELPFSCE